MLHKRIRLNTVLAVTVSLATAGVYAGEKNLDFEDETTRVNYSLGYQIGGDFKRQGVDMNAAAVVQGIKDALSEADPKMSTADMQATLVELKQKVTQAQRDARRKSELQILEDGEAYMAAHAEEDGVVTTESGLQYRIVSPGDGRAPLATDLVTVNYHGAHPNGVEFDSGEAAKFRLNAVIRGWTEGLQLIGEGGHIELVVPPELAYGTRGPMAHRTLVFDIELLAVESPDES